MLFRSGEVRNPGRNVPLSLALGTAIVIGLYVLANCAYLMVLPFQGVQNAPSDRVAAAMLQTAFPSIGGKLMASIIMVSAFGCINGMVFAGARACYAMAQDGLFFGAAGRINRKHEGKINLFGARRRGRDQVRAHPGDRRTQRG